MEEIEGTNRAAVESCHRVLNLLHQQGHGSSSLVSETREAVSRFKRVGSLLSKSVGHARFRRANKKPLPHLSQTIFLDPCLLQTTQLPESSQKLRSSFHELSLRPNDSLTLGTRSFSLKAPPLLQLNQQQQQQQLQAHHLHQQQQRHHQAEIMLRKCSGGISLSFDNSSCTPTMSSTRSFVSSLSIDGSVANAEGRNSFHVVGDQSLLPHSKRKCLLKGDEHGSSSRCHCSKKRSVAYISI